MELQAPRSRQQDGREVLGRLHVPNDHDRAVSTPLAKLGDRDMSAPPCVVEPRTIVAFDEDRAGAF